MHTLFKANLLARAGLHCLSNLITNAHGEKVNIVLTEFGYLCPTSSASLNTVESNCLLYVPTVIRFSRALINVMGECFSNHIVQWCGNKMKLRQPKWVTFLYSTYDDWVQSRLQLGAGNTFELNWYPVILRHVFLLTIQCEPVSYLFTEPMQH